MGIPSYFSHIIRNYPNIQVKHPNGSTQSNVTDHFFMDCNSIIYDVYYAIINNNDDPTSSTNMTYDEMESKLITGIIDKILAYIKTVSPKKTIYIAFDGVAPFAKMEQQRTRRYRSWLTETLFSNKSKNSYPIYSGMFTPGTPFMQNLSKKVRHFFETTITNIKCIVSATDMVGEGEHKLFVFLREYSKESSEMCSKENIVLYGLDADLIMLSIFHCNLCNNIFIMRELPPDKKDSKRPKNETVYIDIKALCDGIVKEIVGHYSSDVLYIYDYVFLCFFLGNDFLPHFPALNIRSSGVGTLMDVYRNAIHSKRLHFIAKDHTNRLYIEWKNVGIFISELSRSEHSLILTEYDSRKKAVQRISTILPTNEKDREDFFNNIPLMYRAEELYIAPEEYNWKSRYYSTLFHSKEISSISENYLEGLEWVFLYYSSGCPHWKWKYNYAYPPLLDDLRKYIHSDISPIRQFYNKNTTLQNIAFTPQMQLLYVLPRVYLHLLPDLYNAFLSDKMDKYYPIDVTSSFATSSYSETTIQFVWAFCRFFWESHVVLPEIPLGLWANEIERIRIA
jgi:5'-3' exonuclease